MKSVALITWIGNTDLRAASEDVNAGLGPIAQAATSRRFESIHLLCDFPRTEGEGYIKWLATKTESSLHLHFVTLSGPTEFAEIYKSVSQLLSSIESHGRASDLVFHLSPGTPAMAAVWILLGKTSYPAELIESSAQKGVRTVSFPFDISVEYLPAAVTATDSDLALLTQGLPPAVPEFSAIVHRCHEMKMAIAEARRVAVHDVPVIIQGESGTGKELFARAIHESSGRSGKPFIEVNCGAIPEPLFEAEFFGHTAGAFTDAKHAKDGYCEQADGGTLFLDEVGELSLAGQVKLLRTLQDGKVRKVGSSGKPKPVDFRVIAATNRNLLEEVGSGRFREDLFHRLAVGLLHLPPLRQRAGDMNVLIDYALEQLNSKNQNRPGWAPKKLSAGARNLLHQHLWPGNVRELFNTISRASIWTAGPTIEVDSLRRALIPLTRSLPGADKILNRSLGNGFDLNAILGEVASHYLLRAQKEAATKSEAAALLGFSNATTFTNWLKKYGLET